MAPLPLLSHLNLLVSTLILGLAKHHGAVGQEQADRFSRK